MSERTIPEAEQFVDSLVLTGEQQRAARSEINAAKASDEAMASHYVASWAGDVDEKLLTLQRTGCEVRDWLEGVAKEAMPLIELRSLILTSDEQIALLESQRDELARQIEELEQVEADPATFASGLRTRFQLRHRFSF